MNSVKALMVSAVIGLGTAHSLACNYGTAQYEQVIAARAEFIKPAFEHAIQSEETKVLTRTCIASILKSYSTLVEQLYQTDKEFVEKVLTVFMHNDWHKLQFCLKDNPTEFGTGAGTYILTILADLADLDICESKWETIFESTSLATFNLKAKVAFLELSLHILDAATKEMCTEDRKLLKLDHWLGETYDSIQSAHQLFNENKEFIQEEKLMALNSETDSAFELLETLSSSLNITIWPLCQEILFSLVQNCNSIHTKFLKTA